MDLKQLREIVRAAPTMMGALQELEIIKHISVMSDEELLTDTDTLEEVLARLYESHTGSAIFQVDDDNGRNFEFGAARLRALAADLSSPALRLSLESVAKVLETRFRSDSC